MDASRRLGFKRIFVILPVIGLMTGAALLWQEKDVHAQGWSVVQGFCPPAGPSCPPQACVVAAQVNNAASTLEQRLEQNLEDSADNIENHIADEIDDMVEAIIDRIDLMETNLQTWWETWYWYDFRPTFSDIAQQINTRQSDQERNFGSFMDAQNQVLIQQEQQLLNEEAHRTHRYSENNCVVMGNTGGQPRINHIARQMRGAWERRHQERGLNVDVPGPNDEFGPGAQQQRRWNAYVNVFCDPDNNNGKNGGACAAAGTQPNADIKSASTLFDPLTIDVTDADTEVALDALVENLVGPVQAGLVARDTLNNPTGQDKLIQKRSYIARKSVARSVPDLIASWRMPGSQMAAFVSQIRQEADAQPEDISANPSYKELMHAMTVDRFMTGQYGLTLIDEPENIERERIILGAFYLMQLRDYYELLERMALTLAVQVAMEVESTPSQIGRSMTPN